MSDDGSPTVGSSRCRGSWRQRTGSSSQPELIVCFLASHVATAERAHALARTLQSIRAQQPTPPPPVSVSWSAEPAVAPLVRQLLAAEVAKGGIRLQLHAQPAKLSQFEHLRALTAAHSVRRAAWVLFSDDDDLWSERRHALYAEQCAAASYAARAVLCRRKTIPYYAARGPEPVNGDDVREMLAARACHCTDADLPDGLEEDEHNLAEYFDYAVRYEVLSTFFAQTPVAVTQHRFCDLSFAFLLNHRGPSTVRFLPSDPAEFVYYYSRGATAGGASNSRELRPEETELARREVSCMQPTQPVGSSRRLSPLSPLPSPGARPPRPTHADGSAAVPSAYGQAESERSLFGGDTRLAEFVLGELLATVEQELVKIRVTGGVVPLQLVHCACAHEVCAAAAALSTRLDETSSACAPCMLTAGAGRAARQRSRRQARLRAAGGACGEARCARGVGHSHGGRPRARRRAAPV